MCCPLRVRRLCLCYIIHPAAATEAMDITSLLKDKEVVSLPSRWWGSTRIQRGNTCSRWEESRAWRAGRRALPLRLSDAESKSSRERAGEGALRHLE